MTFLLYPQVQFVLITNNSYANMLNWNCDHGKKKIYVLNSSVFALP